MLFLQGDITKWEIPTEFIGAIDQMEIKTNQ